jgi:hypothetical protein
MGLHTLITLLENKKVFLAQTGRQTAVIAVMLDAFTANAFPRARIVAGTMLQVLLFLAFHLTHLSKIIKDRK